MENNEMIITITGTGTSQGVPVIGCHCAVCTSTDSKDKRLRSSIHVNYKNKSIVVDTGPDFRQQMLKYNVGQLDAVLFTHEHKDHVAGLDDIRPYNFKQKKSIDIFIYHFTSLVRRRSSPLSLASQPNVHHQAEVAVHTGQGRRLPSTGLRVNPI